MERRDPNRRPERLGWAIRIALAAAGLAVVCAARPSGTRSAVVISASSTAAYAQATEGLRAGLAGDISLEFIDIGQRPQKDDLTRALAAKRPNLVIAIGPEAAAIASSVPRETPMITTMTVQSDTDKAGMEGARRSRLAGAVVLDIPVGVVCQEWRRLFPGKARLGILHNPRKEGPGSAALADQAAAAGCSARVVECTRAEDLLGAFQSLRSSVDLVWCVPDSSLYNSATVTPLLMTSLKQQLPLLGFSESFVRAGAVVGVYPDYSDIGRQTAELARQWFSGSPLPPAQSPRTVRVALNYRVARLMGLHYAAPPDSDGRILVLK